jgi:hypothetical protein
MIMESGYYDIVNNALKRMCREASWSSLRHLPMRGLRKITKIVGIYSHGRDSNRVRGECKSEKCTV